MSDVQRSHRTSTLEALLLVVVGILILTLAFSIGSALGIDQGRAEVSASDQYQRAKESALKSCVDLHGSAIVRCAISAVEGAQNQSDSRQVLFAQLDIVEANKYMFWLSVLTALITAIGVWFVKLTLDASYEAVREASEGTAAAREAADAAIEANRIATDNYRSGFKPWLEVSAFGRYIPDYQGIDSIIGRLLPVHCPLRLRNIGEMPATIESVELWLLHGPEWPYVRKAPPHWDRSREAFYIINKGEECYLCERRGVIQKKDHELFIVDVVGLTQEQAFEFKMRPPPVAGQIIYSDPLGVRRVHRFTFQAEPVWIEGFSRYGGRACNYENELRPAREAP